MSATPQTQSSVHPGASKVVKYSEFVRPVEDFFSKDFPSGTVKVEARTLSRNIFATRSASKSDTFSDEFKVTAIRDLVSGAVSAEVKSTSHFAIYKNSMEAKSVTTLTSNNLLTQQLVLFNPVLEGLKLDITGSVQPTGTNNAKATIELNQGTFLSSTSVDVFGGPVLNTDLAGRVRDFQLGGQIGYDVSKGTIDKYSLAISLDRPREKAVLQALTGLKTFTASYFQKFNDQLEVAYRATWNSKVPNLTMEVGAKWYLMGGGFFKTKLDNVGRLGLALASEPRPGMQVILGATVDTAKLNENAHKLGLSLSYSA